MFLPGNQAALKTRPAVEAAVLDVLRAAKPAETWERDGYATHGVGEAKRRARRDPGDVCYLWLARQVRHRLAAPWSAQPGMAVLRVVRRLQQQGVVAVTRYRSGQIGAVRLLASSPTDDGGSDAEASPCSTR